MAKDLWNLSSLIPPPVNSYKTTGDSKLDARQISTVVEELLELLQEGSPLKKESVLLTKIHYKMGRKFRHDIGYSYLRRTHVALMKQQQIDFSNIFQTFLDVVVCNLNAYLPTRQMFEFVLIRMQTLAKMLCRIIVCSRKAATFYYDRIRRDDAMWLSLMPYAILSKVWYVARHLLKNCCRCYNSLVGFRTELKEISSPFIPEDYVFPEKLELWLDEDWLDENAGQCWKTAKILAFLESNKETIFGDESPNLTDDDFVNKFQEKYSSLKDKDSDVGEAVSRDNIATNSDNSSLTNTKKSKTKSIRNKSHEKCKPRKNKSSGVNKHNIKNVTSKKSLKKFIKLEEMYREKSDSKSVTSHLGFMQWQSLKSVLLKMEADKCSTETDFSNKLTKIWDERF